MVGGAFVSPHATIRSLMSSTPLSLLERIRQRPGPGDWDRVVSLYTPVLQHWLRSHPVQGADADDLVQTVLAVLVEKLPLFAHSGRAGAFRTWLRRILVYQVRYHWRVAGRVSNCPSAEEYLEQLEAADGELTRRWDLEHDRHVARRLLELIRDEFTAPTWEAFERYALHGRPPAEVAVELGLTVNAVLIARSRVLRRLREEAAGLVDEP